MIALLWYAITATDTKFSLLLVAHNEAVSELTEMEWVTSIEKTPTFAFCIVILTEMQAILYMFIRSLEERNFPVYVESMQGIEPIFFSIDHF